MKTKKEYVLQQIAGQWLVIDVNSKSINFNNLLALNKSARFIWEKLEKGSTEAELIDALSKEFGIDRLKAETDVKAFINKLVELGCIED